MITSQQIESYLCRSPVVLVNIDESLESAIKLGILIETVCDALNNDLIMQRWMDQLQRQDQKTEAQLQIADENHQAKIAGN